MAKKDIIPKTLSLFNSTLTLTSHFEQFSGFSQIVTGTGRQALQLFKYTMCNTCDAKKN
jgi:hypothetical protein